MAGGRAQLNPGFCPAAGTRPAPAERTRRAAPCPFTGRRIPNWPRECGLLRPHESTAEARTKVRPGQGKAGGRRVYSSRSAEAMGRRAARMAGSRPPTRPIAIAHTTPCTSNGGVTAKANVTWLKLCQFIVAA